MWMHLVISGSSLLCDLARSLCQICKKCTRQWRYDANNDETERIGSDAIINTGLADGIIAWFLSDYVSYTIPLLWQQLSQVFYKKNPVLMACQSTALLDVCQIILYSHVERILGCDLFLDGEMNINNW